MNREIPNTALMENERTVDHYTTAVAKMWRPLIQKNVEVYVFHEIDGL